MTHRPASMDLDAVREGLEAAVVAAGESLLAMLRRGTVRVPPKRRGGPAPAWGGGARQRGGDATGRT